ncbi:hypothetical protein F4780DRAFT_755837 [Xylariomycetidae sp. FL0641]|nr:hypothetical protein F4780DRAFT_755837 [Xylariomycetidae sp. FL0641]
MRGLITERTDVPIPPLVVCNLSDTPEFLSLFLILELVEGRALPTAASMRSLTKTVHENLDSSLASIYSQLRRLDFPSLGYLLQVNGEFEVCEPPTLPDIHAQELEGQESVDILSLFYVNLIAMGVPSMPRQLYVVYWV